MTIAKPLAQAIAQKVPGSIAGDDWWTPVRLFLDRQGLWSTPLPNYTFSDTTLDTGAHIADAVGTRVNKAAGDVWRYGDELVDNGDFSDGTTGWTAQSSGAIAAVGGECELTAGGGSNICSFSRSVSCVVGARYEVTATARQGTTTQTVDLKASIHANLNSAAATGSASSTGNTQLRIVFTATASTMYVGGRISGIDDAKTAYFDNISVREVKLPERIGPNGEVLPGELVGSELVANGGFDDGLTGWTVGTGLTATVENGAAKVTRSGAISASAAFKQTLACEIGKFYEIKFTVTADGDSGASYLGGFEGLEVAASRAVGQHLFVAKATSATPYLSFWPANDPATAYFDNINVREIRCPELVINGGFDADTDWTDGEVGLLQPDATITGGVLNLPRTDASNYCYSYQAISDIDVGAWFELVVEAGDNSTQVRVGNSANDTTAGTLDAAANATERLIFQSTADPQHVTLAPMTDSATSTVKSITVRPLGTCPSQSTTASKPTLAREPEGGRRNLLTYSEDFTNAVWVPTVSTTVTANQGTSPDGTETMDSIAFGGTSGKIYYRKSGLKGSATYTFSVVLAVTSGTFKLKLWRTNATDWTSATVSDEITVTTTPTRYTLSFTTGATETTSDLGFGDEDLTAYVLPATGSVLAWGAQLDEGALTNYQRVRSQYDVYEEGKRHRYFDRWDGGDRLELPKDIVDVAGSTTLIVAVRRRADQTKSYVFGPTSDAGFGLQIASNKIRPFVQYTDGTFTVETSPAESSLTPLDQWCVISIVFDRTNLTLKGWVNGALTVSLAANNLNLTAPADMYCIGSDGTTGNHLTGDTGDAILRPFAMGDATRKRTERALAAEYGVTLA